MHRGVGVGLDDGRLQRMLLHATQLVANAVARAGLLCPARVHDGRLVIVGKEAHQLGPVVAGGHDLIRVGLDLSRERGCNVLSLPARHCLGGMWLVGVHPLFWRDYY